MRGGGAGLSLSMPLRALTIGHPSKPFTLGPAGPLGNFAGSSGGTTPKDFATTAQSRSRAASACVRTTGASALSARSDTLLTGTRTLGNLKLKPIDTRSALPCAAFVPTAAAQAETPPQVRPTLRIVAGPLPRSVRTSPGGSLTKSRETPRDSDAGNCRPRDS